MIHSFGENIWMILLVLIVFVLVLFLPSFLASHKDPELESMKPILYQILSRLSDSSIHSGPWTLRSPKDIFEIQIRKSSTGTYTLDKEKIYLVTEKSNGEKYNKDTILFVLLHEIAHVLSPDEHHTKLFHDIERSLHREATKLGFLKRENVEIDYPCHI